MVTLINCISITDPWGHVGTVSRVDRVLFCLLARTSYVELPGQAWSIRICKKLSIFCPFQVQSHAHERLRHRVPSTRIYTPFLTLPINTNQRLPFIFLRAPERLVET
jgi:hypothetical protein